MATRAAFRIRNEKDVFLTFTTTDGFPSGMASEIANWIQKGRWVTGVTRDDGLQFNGVGCFAAALIAHIKTGAGGVYVIPHSEWGNGAEDFLYDVIVTDGIVTWEIFEETVSVTHERWKPIFKDSNLEFIYTFGVSF